VSEFSSLAAVDLGSNSFHLQIARVVDDQLYPLDAIRETVRLAAGLDENKVLDLPTQERALGCLARFGERLRGVPAEAVRAVGTSTLRVAKNSADFLALAEEVLGVPIDVVAGREEARLIYIGVAHSLALSERPRLVVDIGGGSTECIIGVGYDPGRRESLRMGCVNFSQYFFPGGRIDKSSMRHAILAGRNEAQGIARKFTRRNWGEAVGSSGTAKALAEIMTQSGLSQGTITRDGLEWLRDLLVRSGRADRLDLPGLRADRKPVLPGGLAVMTAVFAELKIEEMLAAQGAMREGILYDLWGRFHHRDLRDVTVGQFMRRYHVDMRQAARVEALALDLYDQTHTARASDGDSRLYLAWAARLHEIGLSIAHSGFHKHSAYILENADMPGFSRMDQARLALLVRCQRGGLAKVPAMQPGVPPLFVPALPGRNLLVLCLRLSVLFHRSRASTSLPEMRLWADDDVFRLHVDSAWMADNALTLEALAEEEKHWRAIGVRFGLEIENAVMT
jgi:exopolyphosphatase/guanosine-5'-triphosphate,3'-diphosphate pyrophosphatase